MVAGSRKIEEEELVPVMTGTLLVEGRGKKSICDVAIRHALIV